MSDLGNKKIMATNIKRYLDLNKKSRTDLSNALNVPYTTVSDWINGITYPRIDKIEMLANYFGIEKSDLVEKQSIDLSKIPNLIPLEKARRIPILGTICAGNGIWCEENYDGYFLCDKKIKADYALVVKGDSMVDAEIYDGDLVFVKKSSYVENGRIGAVLLEDDNEVTLKKVYVQEDHVVLQACNSAYPPIVTSGVMVLGECIGVYHEFGE